MEAEVSLTKSSSIFALEGRCRESGTAGTEAEPSLTKSSSFHATLAFPRTEDDRLANGLDLDELALDVFARERPTDFDGKEESMFSCNFGTSGAEERISEDFDSRPVFLNRTSFTRWWTKSR